MNRQEKSGPSGKGDRLTSSNDECNLDGNNAFELTISAEPDEQQLADALGIELSKQLVVKRHQNRLQQAMACDASADWLREDRANALATGLRALCPNQSDVIAVVYPAWADGDCTAFVATNHPWELQAYGTREGWYDRAEADCEAIAHLLAERLVTTTGPVTSVTVMPNDWDWPLCEQGVV